MRYNDFFHLREFNSVGIDNIFLKNKNSVGMDNT